MDKRSTNQGIAWYTSIKRLLQDYLDEDDANAWAAKGKALLDVWLGWTTALHNLDGAYYDKL